MPDICQYRTSTKCQHRQPVRDQHWQTSVEHRYHPRHMPALRPHLPVREQYRARCKFLIGRTYCAFQSVKGLLHRKLHQNFELYLGFGNYLNPISKSRP